MELDKRIIRGKRPLTCLDIEQAREFVGKECIFSDIFANFKDINQYLFVDSDYTAILSIDERASCGDYVFRNAKNNLRYSLILPLEWVKEPEKEPEKKYRAFTLAEWVDQHEIGDVIHYRSKSEGIEAHIMYMGTYHHKNRGTIVLGVASYTLDCLFEEFEIEINGEWQPFGVIEDD